MCLAVPGRIDEIDRQGLLTMAKVNFSGVCKEVCIEWVPEAKIGDYVVVHAGFALNLLDEKEALESLKLIEETARSPEAYLKW
ncbi:MAG: HypC/HybG/HupF family hydrogenase formation chaperone [Proteobacteria bacterium]|nr:HypC/HybG/HupF family hydrogenase formation chaperone [Pseudomonadota bacterium]